MTPAYTRFGREFWFGLGAIGIAFHLALIFSGLVPNLLSRPLHMALAAPWALVFMARTEHARRIGWVLSIIAIVCCGYIAFNESNLSDQYGYLSGPLQQIISVALLLCVLEMARRSIGWPLPLVAVIALMYGLFGEYVPGEFGHPGLPFNSFLGTLTITEGGIWGKLTGVSVSIVAIFVIMGAVLNAGEAGQGFMNLANAAAGRLTGGAAKVSVLSSALFGSISGSASANVASTGAITLPTMVRLGYSRSMAAAVEAVASSGGQIMPPLMGAGAFVMVELTGVPYTEVMAAAILPALLYFLAIWAGINAHSRNKALPGLSADQQPSVRVVATTAAFFFMPFALLLERMFNGGYTPQYAACMAILVGFILLIFDVNFSTSWPRLKQRVETVCLTAGKQIALIASIILCAGIIIGVLGQTGLGVKITSTILSVANNELWPALLLTALACLLLGMEVPTTAAYVICVSVAGPALVQLGLEPLLVHLFVFWFALLSTITPPVCGAVFIAAGMVEENWLKVAGSAMALGVGLYLIPLVMIVKPELISLVQTPGNALIAFVQSALGLTAISYGIIAKRMNWWRVPLLIIGSTLLFGFGIDAIIGPE